MRFIIATLILSAPAAHAALEPCMLLLTTRACAIGSGITTDRAYSVNRGSLVVADRSYQQDRDSSLTCPAVGKHELSATLKLDGDDRSNGNQVGALAYAFSFEGNLSRDADAYLLTGLNQDRMGGFDVGHVNQRISVSGAFSGTFSVTLDGHAIALPLSCK